MKIFVIDNYDSFVYNLVHYLEALGAHVVVRRNDHFDLEEPAGFDKILISPGPGIPSEAGKLFPLLERYATSKSILGVCLGQQAIAEYFGGKLKNLEKVHHGIMTPINILVNDEPLFEGIALNQQVGRYHSWVVSEKHFPHCLEIIATDTNGEIMALRHRTLDIRGIQFHPESILTPSGKQMIKNWLRS